MFIKQIVCVCVSVWVCAVYSWMNSKHFNFTMPARSPIVLVVLVANIAICRITSIVELVKHRNCFICKSDICCPGTHTVTDTFTDTHATSSSVCSSSSSSSSPSTAVDFPSSMERLCGHSSCVQCFVGSVVARSHSLSDLYLYLMDTHAPSATMPM